MLRAILFVLSLASCLHAASDADKPFVFSGSDDPFWPEVNSPRLTTPQWVGEAGVDAAVILAVDDMRDSAKYETFLRPILDELKKDGGKAPLSIMTCQARPNDPQLQSWLKEGLSIEAHTLNHPCPLLKDGLDAAKTTVLSCVDLLWEIPHNQPVAFRTPCCDSMSTPSPRVFSEILCQQSRQGHALSIDSSVMCLLTSEDKTLPRHIVSDEQGKERFRKYFPQSEADFPALPRGVSPFDKPPSKALISPHKTFANFGTYIENYPYPYLIHGRLWEFPCMVPSDWEAFNCHGPNHPSTITDWKAALDAVVLKQGVFTFVFHPHGWIKAEQMVEFIRYAREKYGRRVKFLNFREATEKLKLIQLPIHKMETSPAPLWSGTINGVLHKIVSEDAKCIIYEEKNNQWEKLAYSLPESVRLSDGLGLHFVDLNGDGYDDLIVSNAKSYGVYIFNPVEKKNVDWKLGWTMTFREGNAGDAHSLPPLVREDGTNNGVWFKHGAMWVQNEDTTALPDKVRRIPYSELLRQPGPPPLSPQDSMKAMHVKPGFTVELVASEPLVQDPVRVDWDAQGRMWVVEMADYPFHEYEGKTYSGRVKILEDTHRTGVYDKATLFMDGLSYPNGLAFWKNGIFVSSVPEVFYVEEANGKPGERTAILSGFGKGNPQHLVNGFCWGLDGWYYGGNGDSGGMVIEEKSGKSFDLSGRDFRFHPETHQFNLQPGRTQYGRWRDDFGNWFGCNNSSMGWHYFMDDRYLARNPKLAVPSLRRNLNNEPDKLRVIPASVQRRFNWPDAVNTLTSGCNAIPYRDTLFGEEYAHSFFISEPANSLVHREVLEPDGISFRSHRAADEHDSEFLASEDPWSRFTMAQMGPDGCLYVVDMYRLVIEHPEWIPKEIAAHLDLRAGSDRGRIYRIRPEGTSPTFPWVCEDGLGMDAAPISALCNRLILSGNGWVRDTAQRLLLERANASTGPMLTRMLESDLQPTAEGAKPKLADAAIIQALWTLHDLNALTEQTITFALRHPHPLVRRHSVQLGESVLDHPKIFHQVSGLATDPDIRVRVQVALTLGESADPVVPDVLRSLAKRDEGNADMLMALLTSVPKHEAVMAVEAKAWMAAFKEASKGAGAKPPIQIITNRNPDRDKVVKQYAVVTELKGDAARGHLFYKNICAACHRLKNEGNEVGPDLGTMAGKPTDQIVESVMDPSRAVEVRYLTHVVTLKGGREVIGMISEETSNSITMKTAVGTEVFLRGDIKSRVSSTKSLMPDGLENLLKPQDVADVIAWLREK